MLFVVFVVFPRMHAFMNFVISHIRGCASRGVGGASAAVISAVLHLWRVFRMNCEGERGTSYFADRLCFASLHFASTTFDTQTRCTEMFKMKEIAPIVCV